MKANQQQSEVISEVIEYLKTWEDRDVNSPFMLSHNFDAAVEIMNKTLEHLPNKDQQKKAKKIKDAFDKLFMALADV